MSAAVSTAIAVLMTLVFTASGELVLSRFFGAAYVAGAATLAILCVGQCINLAMGQCLVALAMSGEQTIGTKIAVWSSIIKLVLVVVFGYLLGGWVLPLLQLSRPQSPSWQPGAQPGNV